MNSSTTVPRSYEDFIPSSEWIREEAGHKLILQLQGTGFRKEHLKVQHDKNGNLRISGVRSLENNVWRRFSKVFRLPENCDADQIRAKFENGILTIILPKVISEAAEAAPVLAPPTNAPQPQTSIPKSSEPDRKSAKIEEGKAVNEKTEATGKVEEVVKEKRKYEPDGLLGMKMKNKQLMIYVGLTAVLLVGFVSYVVYKFMNMAEAETGEVLDYDAI